MGLYSPSLEGSAPSSPAAGFSVLYPLNSDAKWYYKTAAGAVKTLVNLEDAQTFTGALTLSAALTAAAGSFTTLAASGAVTQSSASAQVLFTQQTTTTTEAAVHRLYAGNGTTSAGFVYTEYKLDATTPETRRVGYSQGDATWGIYDVEATAYRLSISTAGAVAIPGTLGVTDATTLNSASSRAVDGIRIGADSTNNLLDDASNGAGAVTLYIGNTAITAVCDERVKNIIGPTKRDALGIFSQLEVFDHTWNDPTDVSKNNRNARGVWTGISAQQADPIVPWLVNRPRDGGDDYTWLMDLNYMAPLFIKGFQQVIDRLEKLEHANHNHHS